MCILQVFKSEGTLKHCSYKLFKHQQNKNIRIDEIFSILFRFFVKEKIQNFLIFLRTGTIQSVLKSTQLSFVATHFSAAINLSKSSYLRSDFFYFLLFIVQRQFEFRKYSSFYHRPEFLCSTRTKLKSCKK